MRWPSDKLEEITTGFMRINRTLVNSQKSLAVIENPDQLKEFVNFNMMNSATQGKEGWTTTKRINSLI